MLEGQRFHYSVWKEQITPRIFTGDRIKAIGNGKIPLEKNGV